MDFGFDFIHQLAGASKILDGVGIFFGKYAAYLFVLFFLIAAVTRRGWRERISLFLFTAFSLLLASGIIEPAINFFFPIDRPFAARGFTPLFSQIADASFPSGHATFFFTLATVIFLQMSARWGIVAYIGVFLISLGRVFAGVHYPIDILGGAIIGLLVPLIVRSVLPQLSKKPDESLAVESPAQNG